MLPALIAIVSLTISGASLAQTATESFPNRPVTIVVPFPPGGGTDVGARLVAQKLSAKWGQSVVIENKGGAAGIVGAEAALKAKPDGYTLFVGNIGTQAINPSLYKKMSYDPASAFAPIGMIAELPLVLLATPGLPVTSSRELIAQAKAQPERITYASSGAGGAPHLAAEMYQSAANVKLTHVPYKGGGPAVADLLAGHVQLLFATVLESIGHVRSGKLKGLAVTSTTRSPALPDMPTLAESGLAGFETGSWIAVFAPNGVPKALVDKVSADLKEVLSQNDTRQALIQQGATPLILSPEELRQRVEKDRKTYAKIIQDTGIKID
jgi:tripartite-type tricarboxylate transporter receptor subunit TctC